MASTKFGLRGRTYAQNLCCDAVRNWATDNLRYQTNSDSKLLIYIGSLICFFCGHFKKTLDLQGLRVNAAKLSTKLSTKNLKNFKVLLNQALRGLFAGTFGEYPISEYATGAGS